MTLASVLGGPRSPMGNIVALATFTLMLAGGQILFKKLGLAVAGLPPAQAALVIVRDPKLYGALTLYGFATLLWIWILSRVPLSQAYPWVAGGTAIVPFLGWYLFGERLHPMFWAGVALILAGLALVQYASQST